MPLTDVHIRSLKPADKPHKYSDGGGLFLFIPPSGSKLWRMAYRFEGKSRLLSFGAYPAVSLKDARERRDEARRMAAFSVKHQGTVMYRLRNYIFPFIGTTPIARLEVQDIMAVLRPLEMKRCYETSRRVLQIINQVFRYAVITGRARHNIAADLRRALRPRRVTHRAAVLTPEKVGQLL